MASAACLDGSGGRAREGASALGRGALGARSAACTARAQDGAAGGPAAPRLCNVLCRRSSAAPGPGLACLAVRPPAAGSRRARCVNMAARGSGCCYFPVKAGRAGAVSTCFTGEEASLRVCAGRPRGSRVLALTPAGGVCAGQPRAPGCPRRPRVPPYCPGTPRGAAGESPGHPRGRLGLQPDSAPALWASVESAYGWESWLCPSEG